MGTEPPATSPPPTEGPPGSGDVSAPLRPPLAIMHLIVWTACTAIYLGIVRWLLEMAAPAGSHFSPHDSGVFLGLLLTLASVGSGASLAGLLLVPACRGRGQPFPLYPGEYMIVIRGYNTVMQLLGLALFTVLKAHPESSQGGVWLAVLVWFALYVFPEALMSIWAVRRVGMRDWQSYFGMRALARLLLCLPMPAVLLLMTVTRDAHPPRYYPWTHWLGIGLELWWHLPGLMLLGGFLAIA